MREASKLFREKPLTALETGKFWVEHVIRHKNSSHLQPSGLPMNFFELQNVDVYVIILLILLLLSMFPVYIIKKLYMRFHERFVSVPAKTKTS